MEVVYRFTFEEGSDDQHELNLIQKSRNMYLALYDLSQKFREWYKYGEREAVPTEEIRETFYDILSENDVNLDQF